MKILLSMDESSATATRVNSGSLGALENQIPVTEGTWDSDPAARTVGEGCPTLTDDNGGRCAVLNPDPDSFPLFSDLWRKLYSGNVIDCSVPEDSVPVLPVDASSPGFSYGVRFKWTAPYNNGWKFNILWGIGLESGQGGFQHKIQFKAAHTTDYAQGAQLEVAMIGGSEGTVDATLPEWDVISGSPSQFPIAVDGWYRVAVKCYWNVNGSGYGMRVFLYEESTGSTFVWQLADSDAATTAYSSNVHSWQLGYHGYGAASSTVSTPEASVDEAWFYADELTDDELQGFVRDGLSIPWVEPDYYREAAEIHSAVTKENASFPKTRALSAGATVARHPTDVLCQEVRARLEGWKAGQPWALRQLEHVFDPAGPFGSQRARRGALPDLSVGVWRAPGMKPYGACEDARNVEFTARGPRRRRGFKIRRDVDSTETGYGFNSFHTFRDYNDELFKCYKVGSKVYREIGESAESISTGWSSRQIPDSFTLDGRLILLSAAKQGIWNGGSTFDVLGTAAPASLTVAASSGGTLNATYYYAATLYDPVSGDESGPYVSAAVSPATEKVTLTLPATAPDTRFTQYRIYRTNAGGSPPNLFLISTVTVAASVVDTGAADGTQLLPQVTDTSGTLLGYITGAAPDTFAIGVAHLERAIYAKGTTNPERIYIAEPNEPARWFTDQWIAADGPVRAIASWQGRIVVFTDNTVEIVESDFIRDTAGALNITRNVVSRSTGAFGPRSVITYQGNIFWLEARGVFTMQGTNAVPISERIKDLFPYINSNLGAAIVGGWNHVTRTLWWTLPSAALQTDSGLMQTQFVMPVDEPEKWYFHSLEATYVGQFDDDLNGIRFGAIDHAGVFKELETYEGDGQEGDETDPYEDVGTDDFGATPLGITSISTTIIAVEGTPGWTVDEHRGKGVILRDRSTGLLYSHTIRSNTAASFTVDRTPSTLLAAGDGYYIGGMDAFVQFAGHDFGSANRKIMRQVQYTFADLTQENLYL